MLANQRRVRFRVGGGGFKFWAPALCVGVCGGGGGVNRKDPFSNLETFLQLKYMSGIQGNILGKKCQKVIPNSQNIWEKSEKFQEFVIAN